MISALVTLALLLVLLALETAAARWLPGPAVIPLALPLALAGTFVLPHRQLFRLSLIAGVVAELGSGLPVGTALVATTLAPHAVLGVLRRPRGDLPVIVRGLVCAAATLAVLLFYRVLTPQHGPIPRETLLAVSWWVFLFPSLSAGLVAVAAGFLLHGPQAQRVFAHLGIHRT